MAITAYIADPSDTTLATRLVDLNGYTTGGTGFQLLSDFAAGDIATNADWITQAPFPGGIQAVRSHPITTMTFRLRAVATSYDSLMSMARSLSTALDQGGTIVWQPPTSANPIYIDYFSSPIHSPYGGQTLTLYEVTSLLQTPQGLPLEVWRFPYSRGSVLAAAANLCTNATLLVDEDGDGVPDFWVDSGSYSNRSVDWTNRGARGDIATTSSIAFLYQMVPATAGTTYSVSFEAKVLAVGSGGCQMRAVIGFRDAAQAPISAWNGTTVPLTTSFQKMSVSHVADAGTAYIKVQPANINSDANTYTVVVRNVQCEAGASATPFRVGVETVNNDVRQSNGKSLMVYNGGSANALAKVTVTGESGAQLAAYRVGRRSAGNLARFIAGNQFWMLPQDTSKTTNLDSDTTQVTDTAATSNLTLQSTFSSGTEMRRKWRQVVTISDVTSLDGAFRVYAIVKLGTAAMANIQLRWATFDNSATTPNQLPIVPLNGVVSSAQDFIAVDMGVLSLIQPSKFVLEGWAQPTTTVSAPNTNIFWDAIVLFPATEALTYLAIPELLQSTQVDFWTGSQLIGGAAWSDAGWGSGSIAGTTYLLNAQTTACGSPPAAGVVYPAGQHVVSANVTLKATTADAGTPIYGVLDVHKVGTAFGSVVPYVQMFNTGTTNPLNQTATYTLNFTADGSSAYIFRVTDVVANGSINRRVVVNWMRHAFAPVVQANSSLVLDGTNRLASVRDSSSNLIELAQLQGGFVDLAPGPNVLVLDFGDMPDAGLGAPDARQVRPKHVPARAPTVAVDVLARDLIM